MISGLILAVLLSLSPSQSPSPQDQNKPAQPPAEVPSPPKIGRIRVSSKVAKSMLKHKVTPIYPQAARDQRLQGTVHLHVIISTDGKVEQLEVVSGDEILAKAAVEAVRKWEYRPTLLNGEPVEVDTTVNVVFSLNY
jgi:periplasmic protein TonB